MTPLHYAAWRGRPAAIRLLLKAGASVDVRDNYGRTPLAIALKQQRLATNQHLDYGRENYGPLTEVVRLLKRAGAKV